MHQIDLLFPEWLHVDAAKPTLLGIDNESHRSYPIVDGSTVHDPDDLGRIKRTIQGAKEDTEVFPHLNNYNSTNQVWDPKVGDLLKFPANRTALREQILHFLAAYPFYRGLSLRLRKPERRRDSGLSRLHPRALSGTACAQPAALCSDGGSYR